MDGDMKQLRVRFSGVAQEDHHGSPTVTLPSQRSAHFGVLSNGEEYDAAYAATVAAVAYAIAAREEERLASEEKNLTETFASGRKPAPIDEPQTTPHSKSIPRRGESLKRPIEGSKSSKWFSSEDPIDDDEPGANVSVRRPLRPAQKRPEGVTSDQNVAAKVGDSAPSIKEDPGFARKAPDKKGSRKIEQDEANQTKPQPAAPTVRPTSSHPGRASVVSSSGTALSNEAQAMADAWEKEKLAKIKKQYSETMETISEWEAEKKAKARRQKDLKDESDSERKRIKALENYNEEMSRINKVAAASRLTAEEKRRNAERKVREKKERIRSTGKLPRTCGCF